MADGLEATIASPSPFKGTAGAGPAGRPAPPDPCIRSLLIESSESWPFPALRYAPGDSPTDRPFSPTPNCLTCRSNPPPEGPACKIDLLSFSWITFNFPGLGPFSLGVRGSGLTPGLAAGENPFQAGFGRGARKHHSCIEAPTPDHRGSTGRTPLHILGGRPPRSLFRPSVIRMRGVGILP